MKYSNKLLKGYENMRLVGYEDAELPNTVEYDALPDILADFFLFSVVHYRSPFVDFSTIL